MHTLRNGNHFATKELTEFYRRQNFTKNKIDKMKLVESRIENYKVLN